MQGIRVGDEVLTVDGHAAQSSLGQLKDKQLWLTGPRRLVLRLRPLARFSDALAAEAQRLAFRDWVRVVGRGAAIEALR